MSHLEIALSATSIVLVLITLRLAFGCKHCWELVDKTDFPPSIETYVNSGGHRMHSSFISPCQAVEMSKKTIVLVIRCKKCGKAKIIKERG